jgi:hypothetical protein
MDEQANQSGCSEPGLRAPVAIQMTRLRKIILAACALAAAVVVVAILAGPSMQRSFFYLKPRGLPPVVGETAVQLLARLQATLETNAPLVAQSLQPGLSD